jgi:hypothetical protein
MLQTTTLKRNLVLEIGEAKKKDRFGFPRWLPPLKEITLGGILMLPKALAFCSQLAFTVVSISLNRPSQKF